VKSGTKTIFNSISTDPKPLPPLHTNFFVSNLLKIATFSSSYGVKSLEQLTPTRFFRFAWKHCRSNTEQTGNSSKKGI
jgi:hypothetical protein